MLKVRFRQRLYEVKWISAPSPPAEELTVSAVDPTPQGQVVLSNGHVFENPDLEPNILLIDLQFPMLRFQSLPINLQSQAKLTSDKYSAATQ